MPESPSKDCVNLWKKCSVGNIQGRRPEKSLIRAARQTLGLSQTQFADYAPVAGHA